MRSAAVTVPAAELPSTYPRERADVQATVRPLRPHAQGGYALSEGRTSLGRAHRVSEDPGQELAAYGVRMSVPVGWARRWPCLAICERHHHAMGGRSRSSRPGP